MRVPFVGRAAELGALTGLVARARRESRPAVALITGEPGSGKSHLVRELVRRLDPRRTVEVSGLEPTQTIPLAALAPLIRRLAVVPEHGPRLEALVFGSSGPIHAGALQAFESAHRAQVAFGPLVLAVDDLQWVDGQSLGLVHYLVTAAETVGGAFVVIAAARPSPAAAEFAATIARRAGSDRTVTLELGPLDVEDGLALATAIAPTIDRPTAEALWRRAAGSPFWLEVLLRAHATGRPGDLLDERLRSLSGDGAALVGALAVAARPLGVAESARLLDWPPEQVAQAVRELEARGLALTAGLGSVRLAHDLIRETVERQIPEAERRRLHAGLARAIEAAAGDDLQLLAEALDHRIAAGLPATDLAKRVAASPRRRLIDRSAMERLSGVADSLPPGSPERLPLLRSLARLAGELGLHETAMRHWGEVAAAAPDPVTRQGADIEAARASYLLGDAEESRAHLARARTVPADPLTAVILDALEADRALWLEHDSVAGALAAERALAGATALVAAAGGPAGLTEEARLAVLSALDAAADASLQQDRCDEAIRLAETAVEIAEPLGDEVRLATTLRAAFELRALGRTREALERYRSAWEAARRLVLPTVIVEAGRALARILRDTGRLDEARAVALETVELESRLGAIAPRWGTSLPVLHSIELSLGRPGALARLSEDAERDTDPHFAVGLHQLIAAALARREGESRAEEVERELGAARAASSRAGCPRCARELTVVSAELLARIGRPEEARRALAAWEASAVGPSYAMRELWGARARTAIALAEGGAPVDELVELARGFEGLDLAEDTAWAYLDLGLALGRLGRRAEALDAYGRAAAIAERIGASGLAGLARRRLRSLGVRAWRRGPGGAARGPLRDLSGREREVATLVATGASNQEIADALAVSPKTVERHLTNILAKVGARNRTELAGLVLADPDRDPDSAPSAGTGFPR